MASVAHVLTDLAQLANEARRKNADVRLAIETAHVLAKKLPASALLSTSREVQTVFCAPFMLALESGFAKLVATALPLLLRLASLNSLSESDLALVIDTIYKFDVGTHPVEAQLKILQVLLALALNYALENSRFVGLVAVSCRLASSGNVVVSNTASAILQQVFSSLFDTLRAHELSAELPKTKISLLSPNSETETLTFCLDELEARCYHVTADLSHAFLGQKLEFFTDTDIRFCAEAALEILENILALNRTIFELRKELSAVLRLKTVPGLLNMLNSVSPQYPLIVRTLRITLLVISLRIASLGEEKELFLASTNHILLDDSVVHLNEDDSHASNFPTHPYWEKSLVVETYKSIFSNFDTVRILFDTFDAHKSHQKVLREIFVVMNSFLENGYSICFQNEMIQVPADKPTNAVLLRHTATLKTPMMDHLDRVEPPTGIPDMYGPFLVFRALLAFVDGVSGFVSNLSSHSASETLEADVDFITSLNEQAFPEVFHLFGKFLYCSSDLESFRLIVRALQKYTHAIGLLGLSNARDSMLSMLSECIVNNAPPEVETRRHSSHLLALGESLVESLSGSTFTAPSAAKIEPQVDNLSRNFNLRQVICLRTFANLTISLGSTLQKSWKTVWITLQWVNYFLEGPDEYGTISQLKDVKRVADLKLNTQDLTGIKILQEKLLESLSEYVREPFFEAFSTLAELYLANETPEDGQTSDICPYNKSFFLKMLMKLSTVDSKTFAFIDSELWDYTASFFKDLATNRTLAHQKRTHIVECYTFIIDRVTRTRFKTHTDTSVAANKSLDALYELLNKLLKLGRAQELLILGCEAEMHLTVLKTLHSLIDDYDKYYQDSWDVVFRILSTAFTNTEEQTVNAQSTKLVDKIVMLIASSFESLKLILDEFLATLPFNQLKALIDTLLQFCSQKYDLNISFSSVSYFWLISDCIHSNMNKHMGLNPINLGDIHNMAELEGLLEKSILGSPELYQALNIYLLTKLSHISTDERTQVREGAIQTLFQILDVQGSGKQLWQLIYDIVFPELLDLRLVDPQLPSFSKKEMMESLNLVLSGLVSVYSKFMVNFEESTDCFEKFWTRFVAHMRAMLNFRWNELNLKVFQTFQDLLLSLRGVVSVPPTITRLLFDFWISVPIDYDFVRPEYQESLALYNDSFKDLYQLMRQEFTISEANQVLAVLNKCARYPVLKPGVNDAIKPSRLQTIVVDNLTVIDTKTKEDDDILEAVILQLTQISAYPYEVRGRIEAKLKSKFEGKLKIPTFVAVGQYAFELIGPEISRLRNLKVFLKKDRFNRIMGDLLHIVQNKAAGIAAEEDENTIPLWVKCNTLILQITSRLILENLEDFKDDKAIWKVLLKCITVTFENSQDEQENVKQYKDLTSVVLPAFFQSEHDDLIRIFVEQVYVNSFLYRANAIEKELMSIGDDYRELTHYDFTNAFGTTAPVEVKRNREIRMNCLKELFRIAETGGTSAEIARDYVAIRAAFSIRRFIADGRLVGSRPLPQIQEDELLEILHGFAHLGESFKMKHMHGLMRLLTQSVIYADRVEGMKDAVQKVLQLGITS